MCGCSRLNLRPAARGITDGGSDHAPSGGRTPVPGDQAWDDGDVHLPRLRGDVLRKSLRVLLLSVRLSHRLAAAGAFEHSRVLRELVADPFRQHKHTAS